MPDQAYCCWTQMMRWESAGGSVYLGLLKEKAQVRGEKEGKSVAEKIFCTKKKKRTKKYLAWKIFAKKYLRMKK
jgi:hypothetical protein